MKGSVRTARVTARLTQRALAAEAGVSQATISAIERGAVPGFTVQRKLAAALNTTPQRLWPNHGGAG
jgi:DNA-binding XRE family transcriptional regulator